MLTRRATLGIPIVSSLSQRAFSQMPVPARMVFRLEDQLPAEYRDLAVTHAMEITPHGLYFLISPPMVTRPFQALLATDFDGKLKSFEPLAKPVFPGSLQVDSAGNVYTFMDVRRGNADRAEIYVYSPKLTLLNVIPVEEFTYGLVLNKDNLMRLGPAGIIDVATSEVVIPLDPRSLVGTRVQSTQQGIALLSMMGNAPQVKLLDFVNRRAQDVTLRASEFASFAANGGGRPMLDATIGEDGKIAAIASRQKAALLGALVLEFDRTGTLLSRNRYALDKRDEFANTGNPEGAMFPGILRRSGSRLYIADPKGHIARYS